MKSSAWPAWAALAAPFALLFVIMASLVMLPRIQANPHRVSMVSTHAATQAPPTVVNLPTIVVTAPVPLGLAPIKHEAPTSTWLTSTNIASSESAIYRWDVTRFKLGMPYYSFGSSLLTLPRD